MERILFPFEVSMDNRNAFIYACKLARKLDVELTLLNAFDKLDNNAPNEEQVARHKHQQWTAAHDEILGLQGYYLSEYANVERDMSIRFGYRFVQKQLLNAVFDIIAKERVGIIVLNMPYYKNTTEKITGYVLNEIMEYTSVPVLLVPERETFQGISRIVYATDFNTLENDGMALQNALTLAQLYGAHVHFLHVINASKPEYQDKGMYQKVMALVSTASKFSYSKAKGPDVLSTVTNYAKDKNTDLIVIVKQKRIFFEQLFHEEYTDHLTLYSSKPVYILRENQRLLPAGDDFPFQHN